MELSVIIVSYNVKNFLEQCLSSIQNAILFLNRETEIIVIDNHSADGSPEYLREKFTGIKLIANEENLGFAKACNQGMMQAKGKYILFINPDTVIPEDCLSKCISFLESHSDAGAAGVKMLDGKGHYLKESKRGYPSIKASFFKLFGLAGLFPRSKTFAAYYLGHLDENTDQEVDIVSGAFMMVPRSVLQKVGGFDEIFFMYGEDIDLSYRIQQAGYKNYYLAGTAITHFKGKSSPRKSLDQTKTFYKAMEVFVKKHYSGRKNIFPLFVIRAGIRLRMLMAFAGNFFR